MATVKLDQATIPTVDAGQRRQAALVVCSHAGDNDAARTILDALGLLTDPAVTQPVPARRPGRR